MKRFYRKFMVQLFYTSFQLLAHESNGLHHIIMQSDEDGQVMASNIVEYLVKRQEDINQIDDNCRTPLNLAIMYARDPIVIQTLLESGANVNAPNLFNVTPLHLAVRQNKAEVVELLLSYNANKNFKNDDNQTAMDLVNNEKIRQLMMFEK